MITLPALDYYFGNLETGKIKKSGIHHGQWNQKPRSPLVNDAWPIKTAFAFEAGNTSLLLSITGNKTLWSDNMPSTQKNNKNMGYLKFLISK